MDNRSTLDLFFPDINSFNLEAMLSFQTPDDITLLVIALISIISASALAYSLPCSCCYFFKNLALKKAIAKLDENQRPILTESQRKKYPALRTYADACTSYSSRDYCPPAAEDFFNGETLAPRILHSKLLPLFATTLTGLGVLGTFVGLTIGLEGLKLDGGSSEIASQIANMTESASTAFVTSVWGVASSLVLSLLLRLLSSLLSSQIHGIQRLTESKFPAGSPAEEFMKDMNENLRGSKDALDGLAERIGSHLQTATDGIGNEIKELTQKLTVALQAQTENANALHHAMQSFVTVISEKIDSRIQENTQALSDLRASITSLGTSLTESLEAQTENENRLHQETVTLIEGQGDILAGTITEQLSKNFGTSLGDKMAPAFASLTKDMKKALTSFTSDFGDKLDGISKSQEDFAQVLSDKNNQMLDKFKVLLDELRKNTEESHQNTQQHNNEQLKALRDTASVLKDAVKDLPAKINEQADRQQKHDERVEELHSKMLADIHALLENQKRSIEELSQQSKSILSAVLDDFLEHTKKAGEAQALAMKQTSDRLDTAVTNAVNSSTSTFNQLAGKHRDLISEIGRLFTQHQEATLSLDGILKKNAESLDSFTNSIREMVPMLHASSKDLQTASKEFSPLAQDLRSASDSMENSVKTLDSTMAQVSASVSGSVDTASKLFTSCRTVSEDFSAASNSLKQVSNSLNGVSTTFDKVARDSAIQFKELGESYHKLQLTMQAHLRGMDAHLSDLMENYRKAVEKMLVEYGEQVCSQTAKRLSSWDKETENFCKHMTDTTQALSSVIEELSLQKKI